VPAAVDETILRGAMRHAVEPIWRRAEHAVRTQKGCALANTALRLVQPHRIIEDSADLWVVVDMRLVHSARVKKRGVLIYDRRER
jgi:hypothetical protein